MTTGAKKQFKRFEGFYKVGQLQPKFIKHIKEGYEGNFDGEFGVLESWFIACEEKYGKIDQPQLVKNG